MKRILVFLAFIFLFSSVAYPVQAKDFQEFTGKVIEYVESFRSYMVVEGLEGRRMTFRVGIRTRYYPAREWPKPVVGNWVRVEYLVREGVYIGYRVTKLRVPPTEGTSSSGSPHPVHRPKVRMSGELTVIKKSVNLRSGPGTEYAVVDNAARGQRLVLKGKTGDWYKVVEPVKRLNAWVYAPLVRVDKRETRR